MNVRYSAANSPADRIAVAVVKAIHHYFNQHPQGVAPGQHFLSDFLEPFVGRELLEARLDELHQHLKVRSREREISEALAKTLQDCYKRMGPEHKDDDDR